LMRLPGFESRSFCKEFRIFFGFIIYHFEKV
jgi:hypothetical protein